MTHKTTRPKIPTVEEVMVNETHSILPAHDPKKQPLPPQSDNFCLPTGDVEMQNLINPPSSTPRDPNAILNECVEIERAIESITNTNLVQLRSLQTRSIDDPDASPTTLTNREIDTLSSSTMALYRQLTTRIVAIKQTPTSADARNKPRVGMVDRKLKQVMLEFQQVEQGYRKKLGEQMARQYRIVNPDATEEEVRAAVEDTENNQVFSQAVLSSFSSAPPLSPHPPPFSSLHLSFHHLFKINNNKSAPPILPPRPTIPICPGRRSGSSRSHSKD